MRWVSEGPKGTMELRHSHAAPRAPERTADQATVDAVHDRLRRLLCEREKLRRDDASALEILRNREAIAATHRALASALILEHERPPVA